MSDSEPIALYYMEYPRKSLNLLSTYSWDPSWQSVEDIHTWALGYMEFKHYRAVEVYANGELLSRQTKVERPMDSAPITVRPWSTAGYGPSQFVQMLEVCVF